MYFLNKLSVVFLLVSYLGIYISPNFFPLISLLSILFPLLLFVNILFLIYWFIKVDYKFLLSLIVILLGYNSYNTLFSFANKKIMIESDLSVMNYNVHTFNIYPWTKRQNIQEDIESFIGEKSPDILCLQEYYLDNEIKFNYRYKYIKTVRKGGKFGQAIFSKYPMINKGYLDTIKQGNAILYADIVKNKDTVRVYNMHMESLSINPNKDNFGEEDSQKLIERIQLAFTKQADQTISFLNHEKKCNYTKIITGDFNNTAFSWMYNKIKNNKKDAFVEAGFGLSSTYDYSLYPLRIDFILVDEKIEVNYFERFKVKYSDHYPILARLNISN